MDIKVELSQKTHTKLKVTAATQKTTMQDLFEQALELLFQESRGVLKGTETDIRMPFFASSTRTATNFRVDEEDLKKLEILSRKLKINRNLLCNIAIQFLFDDLGIENE